jgi:hypothetical protein
MPVGKAGMGRNGFSRAMEQKSKINIASFILRFVQEHTLENGELCSSRGVIRNVQTEEEIHFTRWEDAENFIQQFVSIDQMEK